MKKILVIILFLVPIFGLSQASLKNIRKKSWQTFVYKIPAKDAIQYEFWDSIPVNNYLNAAAFATFATDSAEKENLGVGHYVLISVFNNRLHATLYNKSDLIVLTINNKHRLQLDIRTKAGKFINDAEVLVKNKKTVYNNSSNTYWVSEKNISEATVLVYTPGDTLITSISSIDKGTPISAQKKKNYHSTKLYTILNRMPKLLSKKRSVSNIGASGFLIFNQPKFKPLDTVKFKAYVLNKKWQRYNKPVQIYLNYVSKGREYNQLLETARPLSIGAYVGQFVIADTIPLDISPKLVFKTVKGKRIIQRSFKIEEYVLDEIGTQEFRSEKDIYFKNDSLRFFAGAKDANGLYVMDATSRLILTTTSIKAFYTDTIFVADTLYSQEVKLNTDADTKFVISPEILPKADLGISAKIIFKNSNNELQEKELSIEYRYLSKDIIAKQVEDSVEAVYIENGIEKATDGFVLMNDEKALKIRFPYKQKIDPIAEDYIFQLKPAENPKTYFTVPDTYDVFLSRISKGDTLGFALYNPFKVPVYYTVFNGSNIIATGKQNGQELLWEKVMSNRREAYKVRWQYIWAGKEFIKEETIGLLYKVLNIKIDNDQSVFPGQSDSIKINVTDFKGRPAVNVNLTAVSYNDQFKKDIQVTDPPYLVKYKSKKYIERDEIETDDREEFIIENKYSLGKYMGWIKKFSLDTMVYYKLLFPEKNYYAALTRLESTVPEISIHVVDKGEPQEIYLLYINRQLAFYNGVTERMTYAFPVFPENVRLDIRLRDKFISIDSLYIQPYYKHDLSFDINNLPVGAVVKSVDKFWSSSEIDVIERSMWQMQNNVENNQAYVWQDHSVVRLKENREHVVGPFKPNGVMSFFNPGYFDINFNFEPGYQYKLSRQVARLEKKSIFNKSIKNYLQGNTAFVLGDTTASPPPIVYPLPIVNPELRYSNKAHLHYSNSSGKGKIFVTTRRDSTLKYIVLKKYNDSLSPLVLSSYYTTIENLDAGRYILLQVTNLLHVAASDTIIVFANGTQCVDMDSIPFQKHHPLIDKLLTEDAEKAKREKEKRNDIKKQNEHADIDIPKDLMPATGSVYVAGIVRDRRGNNPIPSGTIFIKGTNRGTVIGSEGAYILRLNPGKNILVFASIGYVSKEIDIEIRSGQNASLDVFLEISSGGLQEVIVTGMMTQRRKSMTAAMTVTTESVLNSSLQGKVSGITVVGGTDGKSDFFVKMRGVASLTGNNEVITVIDGIIFTGKPDIDPDLIQDVTVMSGAEAIALYGPRGANGAIVITTKAKTSRKDFRDYALWEPNFFTDKNGVAIIKTTYPDNVTGWRTYVLGMDKKRRIGKASVLTQSYRPMLAQLNVPLFLVEGDSSALVTKSINYTKDTYTVETTFSVNGISRAVKRKDLAPNDAAIETEIVSVEKDSITATFGMRSLTGFKDAETRKIPVIKKGIEEAKGNFWVLQKDTTVDFTASKGSTHFNLYAQNNTIDIMLEELEKLRLYPYQCMEQICSKITGLILENKIRDQLKQPFKNKKELEGLLKKLQRAQLFDGGWAWWENGKANVYITSYIANALLKLRANPLVEINIRNALLFLHNNLTSMSRDQLLTALSTLSEGKHQMDFGKWINKVDFDSINQHQQWLWVKIRQQQNMPHEKELTQLVGKRRPTMLGGIHWGTENYSWYSNEIATTVIAFEVLQGNEKFKELLPAIMQYFIGMKRNGYWRNTVETATILNAILPSLLADHKNLTAPAQLSVTGDTSFTINAFPFRLEMDDPAIKNISIKKQGGGMVYLTAYQTFFNKDPEPVEENFIIYSSFRKNDKLVSVITSGEKVKMHIRIDVLKDAEFVMLKVPIPAGCIFINKNNDNRQIFKEYHKDKVLIFSESLTKGIHQFEVELEPRYNGTYTLNPAKAELMYFPIFYGRNKMRSVEIKP